jgi:hypothetical protein
MKGVVTMSRAIQIGWWVVKPGEEPISHCPSYYAADHETLQPLPGLYPARLVFKPGYTHPFVDRMVAGVDCVRVSGELYSGFGGVNFAHTPLKAGEAKQYVHQPYTYQIPGLVKVGKLVLATQYAWMAKSDEPGNSIIEVYSRQPFTWEQLERLEAAPPLTPPPGALEAVTPAPAPAPAPDEPEEAEVVDVLPTMNDAGVGPLAGPSHPSHLALVGLGAVRRKVAHLLVIHMGGQYTDLWVLAGPAKRSIRRWIMEEALGRKTTPKDLGINFMRSTLFELFGITTTKDDCLARRESSLADAVTAYEA